MDMTISFAFLALIIGSSVGFGLLLGLLASSAINWLRFRSWHRQERDYSFDEIVNRTLQKQARGELLMGLEQLAILNHRKNIGGIDRKTATFWNPDRGADSCDQCGAQPGEFCDSCRIRMTNEIEQINRRFSVSDLDHAIIHAFYGDDGKRR